MSRIQASEWDELSQRGFKRKLYPGFDAQNGTHFPLESLAETASQNPALEWDALSELVFNRKLCPGIMHQNGMRFPLAGRLENVSQFERSFRDALSAGHAIRKVHPVLSVQTGARFPREWLLGKRVPDWRDTARQCAAQQPLQLYAVEPCRQRGLPDACRLQLFREHSCRADLVHGKAQQRVAVER